MTTYLGYEVLDIVEPDRGDGTPVEFLRPMLVHPNPVGRSAYRPAFDGARQGWTFRWVCRTRAEKVAVRDWIDLHGGPRVPFWVPSYRRDMRLSEAPSSGANTFRIDPIRYALQVFSQGRQRRFLTFYAPATTPATFYQVTSASASSTEFEEVGIDGALGVDWPVTTLISFLMLVRIADDRIAIRHRGPEFATVDVPLIEVPQEAPE